MSRLALSAAALALFAAGLLAGRSLAQPAAAPLTFDHGSRIEFDAGVAQRQPGPHEGGGTTTGYSFFTESKGVPLVFRKRALHPGSGIGLHTQKQDEIYYVLSGRGVFRIDGRTVDVGPGAAMLTRTGSSHALTQAGDEDLVIIIAYPNEQH